MPEFGEFIAELGFRPPKTIVPGRWLPFATKEKRGDNAGRCMLFEDQRGGIVYDWRSGKQWVWQRERDRPMTRTEREELRRRQQEARGLAQAEAEAGRRDAAGRALARWRAAEEASPAHPYLAAKGILPHGIRQDGELLLVPLHDHADDLKTLQTIAPDGTKRYMKGGAKAGHYYLMLDAGPTPGTIVICEGFATGASIREATGHAVAVAFDAGNLALVAAQIHKHFPSARLVIAADDDFQTEGNPGMAKAMEAARLVGAHVARPMFNSSRTKAQTDFNDLARAEGQEAVRASLEAATPAVWGANGHDVPDPSTSSSPARTTAEATTETGAPSEDAMAVEFVDTNLEHYRYVAPWSRWLRWDGKRWRDDSTGNVFALIRQMIRVRVAGTKHERGTATAGYVGGVERLARVDQRLVVLPEHLDADPWLLNTQDGVVDLRNGSIRPHNPADLCTRITAAGLDPGQGAELWAEFLHGITKGDPELAAYLQRVAGYCATGVTTEDVLVYLFGIGANGKSSWAEAVAHALGDYAKVFAAEVLMESKGERHPTDLAQFMGVRFALTSEPASGSTWNDSRVKSLTGDATIAARFMRGDFFEFPRTHKTLVVGNHMPRLASVTHAIRRRVQMVPFRALFQPGPGAGMRERLKAEAGGAILAWTVEGARLWRTAGTAPPRVVTDLTADYLSDQDVIGQWMEERCIRAPNAHARSSDLHHDFVQWCERQGHPAKSNKALSEQLVAAGFEKANAMIGRVFVGIGLRAP